MSQPEWLRRQAAARGRHLAIETAGERATFAQLDGRVDGLAARLEASRRDGTVAVWMENGLPFVDAILACLRLGRLAVVVDPRLSPEEARRAIEPLAPAIVLGGGAVAERGRAVARDLGAQWLAHDRALAARRRVDALAADPARAAIVVFSSGTSGRPKPVTLTLGNFLWSAMGSAARLGTHPDDRWLACLPLSHLGGLSIVFRSVLFGTTTVVHPGFEVAAVRAALSAGGVTMVSLVPTTLARLVAQGTVDAPQLRCALVGGASAPLDLLAEAGSAGVPVAPTYGLTETASQVATSPPGEPLRETGHVGAPLLPTEVRIVDGEGAPVAAGVAGRIAVRGATVAPGCAGPEGWLDTGDLGRLDAGGALTVLGRLDDVILTGGENVAPGEVEAVLERLPGIAEAAVAPLPDDTWGHVVAAWVVPAAGAAPSLEEVRAACAERLAPHKRPRRLTVVSSLPRTALGKIRRGALVGRSGPGGGDSDASSE